ncbi:MAG: DsrE family protein [Steroidobacteraceae bacterium]
MIRGYGGVRPRPDLPSNLTPGTDYKVIVDVVHGSPNHAQVMSSLVRLARLVNLMAYAGIPRDHVHIAAVIEGMAGFGVLTNEAYRKRFNVDNPNLALLHELKSAGVDLMVCAQALAENDWPDSDVSPDVTVTLSALTDFVVFGQRGYSYMQL